MESTSTLNLEIQESILTITVNRPDKLNALNETVLNDLKFVLSTAASQPLSELRGVILTGEGDKAFIAGADIKAMQTMTPDEAMTFGELGQGVTLLFEKLNIPVIACVNGYALGGGLEMAMSCDFIYATENALFGLPEVTIGLIPGFGGTQRLIRYVGLPKCREMVYSGVPMNAEDAKRWGLANEVFSTKEDMLAAAKKVLLKIQKASPIAVGKCKELTNIGESLPVSEGLDLERNGFKSIFETEDAKEGLASFLEKRTPEYKGQ